MLLFRQPASKQRFTMEVMVKEITQVRLLSLAVVVAAVSVTSCYAQSFLDLTSVTPGSTGSFIGTMGGVDIKGSITTSTPGFQFNGMIASSTWEASTIDNSSPQYSYSDIYTSYISLTDRVGYTCFTCASTITITFSSPITNPVFHVANLDGMNYDFSPTAGLMGLSLLKW
jgi:hypothetical protein